MVPGVASFRTPYLHPAYGVDTRIELGKLSATPLPSGICDAFSRFAAF